MSSPIEIEDDESQNRFQVTEFYTIDNAWIKSDKDGNTAVTFYPFSIAAFNKEAGGYATETSFGRGFPAATRCCGPKSRSPQPGPMTV